MMGLSVMLRANRLLCPQPLWFPMTRNVTLGKRSISIGLPNYILSNNITQKKRVSNVSGIMENNAKFEHSTIAQEKSEVSIICLNPVYVNHCTS